MPLDPALEAAKAKLELLSDRDAILDAFFAYGREVFKFAVLFVVRGDAAHGRDVHGLGAPSGLVARLVFPLDKGGILAKAVEYKKAFVGAPAADGDDADLVGRLGRAMPTCVVAPVVVRGRVVAILLGEGLTEAAAERARTAGGPPLELAKEAMFAWTDCVGDAFERLIVRRKSDDGGVVASMRRPPISQETFSFRELPTANPPPARGVTWWAAPVVLVAAGLIWLVSGYAKREPGPEAVVVHADRLPGFPAAVELAPALERAMEAASLSAGELVGIQTEIGKGGAIDVGRADAPKAPRLTFVVATPETEAEIRVDAAGMHGPRKQPRAECDGGPCRKPVSTPECTTARLWEEAARAGARDDDRVRASYAATGDSGPQWSLSIEDRGTIVLDGASCKALSRDRIRPPKAPLSSIPGAPGGVDPSEAIAVARDQSGLGPEARLLEIEAKGVDARGKIDLAQADAGIVYRFADPESVPMAERRWRQVPVGRDGMPITSIASEREPLPLRVKGPVASPRCTFAAAWAMAGLPRDAKARILYGADAAFPESGQWTIEAPSMSARLVRSDMACAAGSAAKP